MEDAKWMQGRSGAEVRRGRIKGKEQLQVHSALMAGLAL